MTDQFHGQGGIESRNRGCCRLAGQGSTEYIILLAVVLVAVLAAVALTILPASYSHESDITQNELYYKGTTPIMVTGRGPAYHVVSSQFNGTYAVNQLTFTIQNVGRYPIRLTKFHAGNDGFAEQSSCGGDCPEFDLNIYLAPRATACFGNNSIQNCTGYAYALFVPAGQADSMGLPTGQRTNLYCGDNGGGYLSANSFGFDYIEYINGQNLSRTFTGSEPFMAGCAAGAVAACSFQNQSCAANQTCCNGLTCDGNKVCTATPCTAQSGSCASGQACCNGLTCDGNKVCTATPCAAQNGSCANGGTCCNGLNCQYGTCSSSPPPCIGANKARNCSSSSDCCAGLFCSICSESRAQCGWNLGQGTCSACISQGHSGCSSDSDCCSGLSCISGQCSLSQCLGQGSYSCVNAGDCCGGLLCDYNPSGPSTCQACIQHDHGGCSLDSDCCSGLRCIQGKCSLSACLGEGSSCNGASWSRDCCGNLVCYNYEWLCVRIRQGYSGCTQDSDCQAGLACVNGTCGASQCLGEGQTNCQSSSDCCSGLTCRMNPYTYVRSCSAACIPHDGTEGCTKDSDCCSGLTCIGYSHSYGSNDYNAFSGQCLFQRCLDQGQSGCLNSNDCCGSLLCENGTCASCIHHGNSGCTQDSDCCGTGLSCSWMSWPQQCVLSQCIAHGQPGCTVSGDCCNSWSDSCIAGVCTS